jgi:predicted DNA-binding transcriptional regulator AlpA
MRAEVQARRLIMWDDVLKLIPMSKVTLYRMIRTGDFPQPVKLSVGRTAFFEDEVLSWQETRERGTLSTNLPLHRKAAVG